jgi:hypothetical protein
MSTKYAHLVSCFFASAALALYAAPREATLLETKASGGVPCNAQYDNDTVCPGKLAYTDTFLAITSTPDGGEIYTAGNSNNLVCTKDPINCDSVNPANVNNSCGD